MIGAGALRQMFLDGQLRWPEVALEFEAFERHCTRVVGGVPDAEVAKYGADLYLCCACAALNREAMAIVEREGVEIARAAIARIYADGEFVRETLQELWDKLFVAASPKIAGYSGRGPLAAWLRVVATRAALDRCRVQQLTIERHTELSERLAASALSPESQLTQVRYQGTFQKALREAIAALPARDRNLLRMQVVGHCSIDQIGRAYAVHRATAARWLEHARERVLLAVQAELAREHPALSESEFKGIARALGGALELNLSVGSPSANAASASANPSSQSNHSS
jgi:RNA polymerase sigma-70 factor, ECF subfamily